MFLFELKNFFNKTLPQYKKQIFVVPCDYLPTKFVKPCGFIINTSDSTKSDGHWQALWINKSGDGFFFDSFGFSVYTPQIAKFIMTHCHTYQYNKHQLQQTHTKTCGYWSAVFLYKMFTGTSMNSFVNSFSRCNLILNDIQIQRAFDFYNNRSVNIRKINELCRCF